ncbi:hypothetical protein PR048_031905 [Dryococelus australis]|uniref:Uncharacterized protein n=1 Tax=Dryococelus australis TaxID=614101 RepID=A0ABQ9GAN0_9NEOP|nr:hypothetical protein PR048_031905 [Dryococelus australis]
MSLTRHKWWQMHCREEGQIFRGLRPLREQLQQVDTGLRALAVQLKEEIREDGRLQKVVQELETDVCRDFIEEKFVLKEDYLFHTVSITGAKWVLCIPNLYRKEVVECHTRNVDIMK